MKYLFKSTPIPARNYLTNRLDFTIISLNSRAFFWNQNLKWQHIIMNEIYWRIFSVYFFQFIFHFLFFSLRQARQINSKKRLETSICHTLVFSDKKKMNAKIHLHALFCISIILFSALIAPWNCEQFMYSAINQFFSSSRVLLLMLKI